jgi:hypothetical protein
VCALTGACVATGRGRRGCSERTAPGLCLQGVCVSPLAREGPGAAAALCRCVLRGCALRAPDRAGDTAAISSPGAARRLPPPLEPASNLRCARRLRAQPAAQAAGAAGLPCRRGLRRGRTACRVRRARSALWHLCVWAVFRAACACLCRAPPQGPRPRGWGLQQRLGAGHAGGICRRIAAHACARMPCSGQYMARHSAERREHAAWDAFTLDVGPVCLQARNAKP